MKTEGENIKELKLFTKVHDEFMINKEADVIL